MHRFLFYTQHQQLYDDLLQSGVIQKMFNSYPSYQKVKELVLPYKKEGSAIILDDQLSGDLIFILLSELKLISTF